MELTIEEALCIVKVGWSTEAEKDLYYLATKRITEVAEIKRAEYKKHIFAEQEKRLRRAQNKT